MTKLAGIPWYRTAPTMPPIGVVVLVRWSGRPAVEASRVRHPTEKREAWLVDDNGKPVFLPTNKKPVDMKRPWAGWHTLKGEPDYWRPLHPDKWRMPLPPPAFIEDADGMEIMPRMWSSTMSFSAVDDAEAGDLAREMEADREHARAGGRQPDADERPEPQWWLDPSAVTYSPPGKISLREAEGRLMRAFNAERQMQLETPGLSTFGAKLARFIKPDPLSPADLAAVDPPRLVIEATGRDRDDLAVVTVWLRSINALDVDILAVRGSTPQRSWRKVGKELGISHEVARARYPRALAMVTAAANGSSTPLASVRRRRMRALRERNRAFKRKS